MKQLERLLVMQGRRCFFCDEMIPAGEASVEHLVASAPVIAIPNAPEAEDAQIALVIADLARRGASRPRKEQTLRNTIAAVFQKKLAEEELSSLLARLQDRKYLSITDGKVGYKLPGDGA